MLESKPLSVIAIFVSLAIATDYAMMPIYNVKLVFTLVFASAYAFGFRMGATIAILTELIWGILSPNGPPTLILPFLMGATVIYSLAGFLASRIWGLNIKPLSLLNIVFGSIMAVCAFCWDTTTNFATGLLVLPWKEVTFGHLLLFETNPLTIYFMISHELGDFALGSALAPVMIAYFLKIFGDSGLITRREMSSLEATSKIPNA